jgi:hypothetical protein
MKARKSRRPKREKPSRVPATTKETRHDADHMRGGGPPPAVDEDQRPPA